MTSIRAMKKQGFSMLESSSDEEEEERMIPKMPQEEQNWGKKKVLKKQVSMRDTIRELKWEKKKKLMNLRSLGWEIDGVRSLTDEDLDELKGSLELSFGFHEENRGLELCKTLPALNLYFAVNRQFSDPNKRMSTPSTATAPATSSASTLYGTPSRRSPYGQTNREQGADGWKLINPGDSPQDVKTKLRLWAKAVACSVRHRC